MKQLSPTSKLLLALLRHRTNPESGEYKASQRQLAKAIRRQPRTVREAIAHLKEAGLLSMRRCAFGRKGSSYWVLPGGGAR
jgi:hypothetical protein